MVKLLFSRFAQRSSDNRFSIGSVVSVWLAVLTLLVAGCTLELSGQAMPPSPGAGIPEIVLDPAIGPIGTLVTVRGEGWVSEDIVLIYLVAPGEIDPPSYTVAGSAPDAEGRFTAKFVVPSESGWQTQELAVVIARSTTDGTSASFRFVLSVSRDERTFVSTDFVCGRLL
jgi:hypothetical protein